MGLQGVMKAIVPVVMDGVLGIYGVIIDVIISAGIGYAHLSSGLACILAGLSAGMAIRIDGDAGVRLILKKQRDKKSQSCRMLCLSGELVTHDMELWPS
ncbi:hypothetical protein SSX86_003013 [Deinandra increscens subsp. villosa]|uniref:Uncharacterized protein n=1 Tax=Deinandra increscens subsp. villosa TaxID=3103831 RepID=A0AAP0DGE4_9ASTR